MGITLTQKGSLLTYATKVQGNGEEVLDKAAEEVRRSQFSTLTSRVKDWTGNLGMSIRIRKSKGLRAIGPNQSIAPYAGWIEDGGRGGFIGYHYVRSSIRKAQMSFLTALKASLKI